MVFPCSKNLSLKLRKKVVNKWAKCRNCQRSKNSQLKNDTQNVKKPESSGQALNHQQFGYEQLKQVADLQYVQMFFSFLHLQCLELLWLENVSASQQLLFN